MHRYKRQEPWSYSLGTAVTIELLAYQPEVVTRVWLSSQLRDSSKLTEACHHLSLPCQINDKAIATLSPKGNCFAIGQFEKYYSTLGSSSQILLVNPSDAGNLGTIIRTAVGFGIKDIGIIEPAVDYFDPKVIRASMGAIFQTRIESFASFDNYQARFPGHTKYPFMLGANQSLDSVVSAGPHTLIFGNEATGLPDDYAEIGQPVVIEHSQEIDSLNLPIAVAIALYAFSDKASVLDS